MNRTEGLAGLWRPSVMSAAFAVLEKRKKGRRMPELWCRMVFPTFLTLRP